jgi:hypothetical protein
MSKPTQFKAELTCGLHDTGLLDVLFQGSAKSGCHITITTPHGTFIAIAEHMAWPEKSPVTGNDKTAKPVPVNEPRTTMTVPEARAILNIFQDDAGRWSMHESQEHEPPGVWCPTLDLSAAPDRMLEGYVLIKGPVVTWVK